MHCLKTISMRVTTTCWATMSENSAPRSGLEKRIAMAWRGPILALLKVGQTILNGRSYFNCCPPRMSSCPITLDCRQYLRLQLQRAGHWVCWAIDQSLTFSWSRLSVCAASMTNAPFVFAANEFASDMDPGAYKY